MLSRRPRARLSLPCQNGRRTAFHAGAGVRELRRELTKIIVERGAHDIVAVGTLLDRRDAEPLQFFLRDANHDAPELFAVLGLPGFRRKGLVVARDQRRTQRWRDRHNNGWPGIALASKQT